MNTITKGYYKHFTHNSDKGVNDCIYEVLGTGKHTETNEVLVVYRPLYPDEDLSNIDSLVTPILTFKGKVTILGTEVKRFELVTDQRTIERLNFVREEMYGKQ